MREGTNMKSKYKLLVGVVAGALIGAAGNHSIHGQEVKTPPVYVVSEADVITDPTGVKEYGGKVLETLAPFKDHYHLLVRSSKAEGLDGSAPPKGIVVFVFDSAEQAHAWYDSPAYAAIRPTRLAATKGRTFLVEGIAQ